MIFHSNKCEKQKTKDTEPKLASVSLEKRQAQLFVRLVFHFEQEFSFLTVFY